MFSFHKPKIYRSANGCCICKAKSSSSRFTDSKKYEPEFEQCFKITEKRSGEICNACVLLVKRWKKLPPGTTRDWHHVVDARAGPGTKSLMKFKSKSKLSKRPSKKNKLKRLQKRCLTPPPPSSPGGLSDDINVGEECLSDRSSSVPSPTPSDRSEDSYAPNDLSKKHSRRRKKPPKKRHSAFVDRTFWKKLEICCGIIFVGPGGGVILDQKLFRPCGCKKPEKCEFEASDNSSPSLEASSSAMDASSAPIVLQETRTYY